MPSDTCISLLFANGMSTSADQDSNLDTVIISQVEIPRDWVVRSQHSYCPCSVTHTMQSNMRLNLPWYTKKELAT